MILGGSRKGESFDAARAATVHGRAYLIGETADELAAALDRAGVPYVRCGDLATAVAAAAEAAAAGRGRPALAGLRELRPVRRLRAARRGVQEAGAEPVRVKRGQLESNVLVLVTLALVAFGLVMVYSATSASAALGGGNPIYYLKRQAIFALLGLVAARRRAPVELPVAAARSRRCSSSAASCCCAVVLVGRPERQRRPPLDRRSAPPPSSRRSSRSSRSRSGSRSTSSQRPAPQTLGELTKPIGLARRRLLRARPRRARPRHRDRDLRDGRRRCCSSPARRCGCSAARRRSSARSAVVAIWLEPYRRARFFSFLDPWHDAQGAGFQTVQAMIGLGSGGIFGRGPRPERREGLLPPRGAHGHDLRDHRRGARPRRRRRS